MVVDKVHVKELIDCVTNDWPDLHTQVKANYLDDTKVELYILREGFTL